MEKNTIGMEKNTIGMENNQYIFPYLCYNIIETKGGMIYVR